MKKVWYIIVLLLVSFSAHAQFELEQGRQLYYSNQFEESIKVLKTAVKKGSAVQRYEAITLLAQANAAMNNPEEAERWYRNLVSGRWRKAGAAFKVDVVDALIDYGNAQRNNGKYAEARSTFLRAMEEQDGEKTELLNYYIASVDSAVAWSNPNLEPGYVVKNTPAIVSKGREFSPVIYNDSILVFCKAPSISSQLDLVSTNIAAGTAIKDIKSPKDFNSTFNSPQHEGPLTFSRDGKRVFFTRTIEGVTDKKNREQNNVLHIFYSEKTEDGKWSEPTDVFPFNNMNYSTAHPALSLTGDRLYFMSDKEGGAGKSDIYYSDFTGSGWSEAVNIGKEINTPGNELFPYMMGDTLFFASDMHPGMGKLDLFYSTKDRKDRWTKPQNMMPPINTIYDDFGMTFFGGDQKGFFSSNRTEGKGDDDIYAFIVKKRPSLFVDGPFVRFDNDALFGDLKYRITDKDQTAVPLDSTKDYFSFQPFAGDTYKAEMLKDGLTDNEVFFKHGGPANKYEYLNLEVRALPKAVLVKGLVKDRNTPLADQEVLVLKEGIPADTAYTNGKGVFSYATPPDNNYTFLALTDEGKADFIRRNLLNYNVMVRSSNNTLLQDVKANLSINDRPWGDFNTGVNGIFSFKAMKGQKVSLNLEKNKYANTDTSFTALPDTDDPESMLVNLFLTMYPDIGETATVKGNVRAAGEPVKNAQVTVFSNGKIVQLLPSDEKGDFKLRLQPEQYYNLVVTSPGFFQYDTLILTDERTVAEKLLVGLSPIVVNKDVRLENIYYDYNKYNIRRDARNTLNKIVTFMEANPKAIIELNAHTDDRSDEPYNLKLSQKRAESAREYMIAEGINASRVTAKGYGEAQLLIPQAQSEFEHQINRRTQFKVVGYIDYTSVNDSKILAGNGKEYIIHIASVKELLPPQHPVFKLFPGKVKSAISSNNTIKYFAGPYNSRSTAEDNVVEIEKLGFESVSIEEYEDGRMAIE